MKNLKLIFWMLLLSTIFGEIFYAQDWANLNCYRKENESIGLPSSKEKRIVFMGNSITEGWKKFCPDFFSGRPYINRGISGQTTPQMLLRFRTDVINLKPAVVVILAGINDIAGNTGPSTLEMIEDNIISMAELAAVNGIKVILCSVLPTVHFPWKPELNPAEKIIALNELIKQYAARNGILYLDYYSSMVDEHKGLKNMYTYDGVHPNEAGYRVMAPLIEEAIVKVVPRKND